jgi:mRNA-degrading endonuclease RelE of RelBE toxin-antitoxin system
MRSCTTERFRKAFERLPQEVQQQARKAYGQFLRNPRHPSLRFKQIHPTKPVYSVRISTNYRAIGVRDGDEMIWFWVGSHADYDKLLARL